MASESWRVRATSGPASQYIWDLRSLRFFGEGGEELTPVEALASGSVSDAKHGGIPGYEAHGCVFGDGLWGGRKDDEGVFFLGARFPEPVWVVDVSFVQPSDNNAHKADAVALEFLWDEDGQTIWEQVRVISLRDVGSGEEEREVTSFSDLFDEPGLPGSPPGEDELTVAPSQPLGGAVHECCYKHRLHQKRDFRPDPDFYFSENCEGLWVCVTRACGQECLRRACNLVRATYPPELRRLWGEFVSPLWAKDPGPMRLIVLDNRTGEQLGWIPELQDDSTGRNGTSCPFVATSREDFFEGCPCWNPGMLTVHEMTHGADMVMRQLVDPYIHELMEGLYMAHREKFCYRDQNGAAKKCYCAFNRDEFFAECHVIWQGIMLKDEIGNCGLDTPEALEAACPDVVDFLRRHFTAPLPAGIFEDGWSG